MPDTTQFFVLLMSATEAKTSASSPDVSNLATNTLVTYKRSEGGGVDAGGVGCGVGCGGLIAVLKNICHRSLKID